MPAQIPQDMAEDISPILTIIFQMTLGIGEPPEDWTSANVSPILKRDRFKASNYRPVSLTILCCKLQENVNNSNVLIHFEHHKILTDCQHGFTARRSCETQLLILEHELADTLEGRWTLLSSTSSRFLIASCIGDSLGSSPTMEFRVRQIYGSSFFAGRPQQVIEDGTTSEKAMS